MTPAKPDGLPVPRDWRRLTAKQMERMTVGALADAHREVGELIAELNSTIKEYEEAADKIASEVIERMQSDGQDKGATARTNFRYEEKEHYNITDPRALHAWMRKTGNMHVLQNRVGSENYRELRGNGVKIPGITVRKVPKFYSQKRKPKETD